MIYQNHTNPFSLSLGTSFINIRIFSHYVFNIDLIITSKTRLVVMRFFLSHPTTELGVRETARALGLAAMQVRNELILLQKAGLLKSRRVANSVQYSLDSTCAGVEPITKLFEVSRNE